jgi:hypothetical protein
MAVHIVGLKAFPNFPGSMPGASGLRQLVHKATITMMLRCLEYAAIADKIGKNRLAGELCPVFGEWG